MVSEVEIKITSPWFTICSFKNSPFTKNWKASLISSTWYVLPYCKAIYSPLSCSSSFLNLVFSLIKTSPIKSVSAPVTWNIPQPINSRILIWIVFYHKAKSFLSLLTRFPASKSARIVATSQLLWFVNTLLKLISTPITLSTYPKG